MSDFNSNEFSTPDPRDPSHLIEGDDAWVSEDDIKALSEEREIMGLDLEQQAENILKENLPAVVQSVVKLARSAQSENVRLGAAKYIIDRNLGRITEPDPNKEDPLREFIEGVVT